MFGFRPEGSVARSPAECGRGGFGAVASCRAGRGREAAASGSPPPEAAPAPQDAQRLARASPDENFLGCPPAFPQSLGCAPAAGGRGGAAARPPLPPPPPPWLGSPPARSCVPGARREGEAAAGHAHGVAAKRRHGCRKVPALHGPVASALRPGHAGRGRLLRPLVKSLGHGGQQRGALLFEKLLA